MVSAKGAVHKGAQQQQQASQRRGSASSLAADVPAVPLSSEISAHDAAAANSRLLAQNGASARLGEGLVNGAEGGL